MQSMLVDMTLIVSRSCDVHALATAGVGNKVHCVGAHPLQGPLRQEGLNPIWPAYDRRQ